MTAKRAPQPRISIAHERHTQLETFMQTNNLPSFGAAIGALMKLAIKENLIPPGIPGVEIYALRDGVVVNLDAGEPVGLTYKNAEALASHIREYLTGTGRRGLMVNFDANYQVIGAGNGVTITLPRFPSSKSRSRTFSNDIAEDLAELLEEQVAKATASMKRAAKEA